MQEDSLPLPAHGVGNISQVLLQGGQQWGTASIEEYPFYKEVDLSVKFFVSFITTHLTEGVFEHDILLEQMVYRHFSLQIVMHWTL